MFSYEKYRYTKISQESLNIFVSYCYVFSHFMFYIARTEHRILKAADHISNLSLPIHSFISYTYLGQYTTIKGRHFITLKRFSIRVVQTEKGKLDCVKARNLCFKNRYIHLCCYYYFCFFYISQEVAKNVNVNATLNIYKTFQTQCNIERLFNQDQSQSKTFYNFFLFCAFNSDSIWLKSCYVIKFNWPTSFYS